MEKESSKRNNGGGVKAKSKRNRRIRKGTHKFPVDFSTEIKKCSLQQTALEVIQKKLRNENNSPESKSDRDSTLIHAEKMYHTQKKLPGCTLFTGKFCACKFGDGAAIRCLFIHLAYMIRRNEKY